MKLIARSQDQSKWYLQLIKMAELADYSPVKGCMVIRPYGYRIWELIQQNMDRMIKDMDVDNAYFPLFIPKSFIEKEKDHLEGFAPEVAVVTHAGGKKLEEELIVRPTSETIIYSMFAKWIHSYNDLPLKLNQWANVVRWEKRTVPFLRTSEFLWQEGHTIHADKEDASKMVLQALEMYKTFMNEYLAVNVVSGRKTEAEKFSGANHTYTCEVLMRDGKALQAGTSHLLDQTFAEAFDIKYTDKDGKDKLPWMTSWGTSTRMIGGVILAHGDDKGLVLPPKIAPIQVVIVPIGKEVSQIEEYVKSVKDILGKDIRVHIDWSDNSPGWKFAQWEMKGVPVRIEIGGREAENKNLTIARRDTGDKEEIKFEDVLTVVEKLLIEINDSIFNSHKKYTEENTVEISEYEDLKKIIKDKKGFVKGYFDATSENEDIVKHETKATTRCVDVDGGTGKCFLTGKEDCPMTYFARAY